MCYLSYREQVDQNKQREAGDLMARAPNPKAEEAKALYKKGMKLIDIANKLELPPGTVRRWKSTHKWDGERSEKKANVRKKRGAPKGNKNAVGHGAPTNNKNAEKHGLFTKWLPEETAKIMGEMASEDPIELLWNNILLQQAAIIRAQNIMYVEDKNDKTKDVTVDGMQTTVYSIQQAWDKQATFLTAQSRAYKTYLSMIKQYEEMVHKNWDLATEEQKARIAALKKQAEDKDKNDKDITVVLGQEIEGWAK